MSQGPTDDGGFGRYPHSVHDKPNPYAPAVSILRGSGGTTMRPNTVGGSKAAGGKGPSHVSGAPYHANEINNTSQGKGVGGKVAKLAGDKKSVKIIVQGAEKGSKRGVSAEQGQAVALEKAEAGLNYRDKERKMIEVRLAKEKQQRDEEAKAAQEERQKLKNRTKSATQKLIIPKYQPRRAEDVQKEEDKRQKDLEAQKKQAREWRLTHKREPIPPANPNLPPVPLVVAPKKQNELNFLDALETGEKTAGEVSNESRTEKPKKGVLELRQDLSVFGFGV